MAESAAEIFKRAFAGFAPIAKRDPRTPGAVEVDLGKVATEIAKVAASHGPDGDVESVEKSLDEIGAFLEGLAHDPISDKIFASTTTELAKRFAIEPPLVAKAAGLGAPNLPKDQGGEYHVDHGSGRAKPPAKGSKEQKDNQYTAGSGLATDEGEEYTDSATTSVATVPGGGTDTTFDQKAGGPNGTKKAVKPIVKAQQPAHPETPGAPGMLLEEDHAETGEPMVSEGFGMNGKKKAKKRVEKRHVTTEELWARDMAAMTVDEISDVKKAAKSGALDGDEDGDSSDEAAPRESTDDRSAPDAKRKKAKKAAGKGKAQYDGPKETVDELEDDEREPGPAKPNTGGDPDETVDEVEGGKGKSAAKKADQSQAVDEMDDEDEDDDEEKKPAKKKGKPFKGAAKPFGADDDDDDADEEDDEDEDDEKPSKTKKSDGDTDWPLDLSPEISPVSKAARLTASEVSAKAGGIQAVARRHAEIRKAALAGVDETPPDELSPDQVASLRKRAQLTPGQRRKLNTKRLKERGYEQGSRELEIEGVEGASVDCEE